MAELISVSPDPPVQGQSAEICYDFDGTSHTQVQLDFTWTPSSITSPSSITVTKDEPCKSITIPSNATTLTIEDTTDVSDNWSGTITPSSGEGG